MRTQMKLLAGLLAILLFATTAFSQAAPIADYHQHLFSPAIGKMLATASGGPQQLTASEVIALLDAAGIQRALLLSTAYIAHLAGTGPGYDDPPSDKAMAVLAEAVEHHDRRTRRLWFDVATCVDLNFIFLFWLCHSDARQVYDLPSGFRLTMVLDLSLVGDHSQRSFARQVGDLPRIGVAKPLPAVPFQIRDLRRTGMAVIVRYLVTSE